MDTYWLMLIKLYMCAVGFKILDDFAMLIHFDRFSYVQWGGALLRNQPVAEDVLMKGNFSEGILEGNSKV